MKTELKKLCLNGLWKQNPALVQILGLCPLLAVSNTANSALGLGLATIFVMSLSGFLVSKLKDFLTKEIRIPIFVLIISSAVSLCELIFQAYFYTLYKNLGIFLPLIVTNCVIIARAESYASKNPALLATLDGFFMGLGFSLVILLLGIIRELIATGKIFNYQILNIEQGFLLASLPAGAFIIFGFIMATVKLISNEQ